MIPSENCGRYLFRPRLLLVALKLAKDEDWVVLCDGVLGCFQASRGVI